VGIVFTKNIWVQTQNPDSPSQALKPPDPAMMADADDIL